MRARQVDITGFGENAVDHVLRLSQFPAPDGKVQIESATQHLGGQIATAIVACHRWGMRARYIGICGDDAGADLHEGEFARLGVETHLLRARNTPSRLSYILVDRVSGSRAVLSRRAKQLRLPPARVQRDWILATRLLHLDAENPDASRRAARWARRAGVPVMCDFDLPGGEVEGLLRLVDYAVISARLACTLGKTQRIPDALQRVKERFRSQLVCATLGEAGALAWDGTRFCYSPSYRVRVVDSTGAGDLFHAGFAYGLLHGWGWQRILDFGCAAAGLNCMAEGARGRIGTVREIESLRTKGKRNPAKFTSQGLRAAKDQEGRR